MKKILTLALAFALVACGKPADNQVASPQTGNSTMQQQVAAIKSCMDEGLSEDTCASVHKQMVTGTLTGSPSMASCEAQYGVGQCGNVPVASANGSSSSIILPLIAGAAVGYLASNMLASRSVPAGTVMPQRTWMENRPAVYQQAVQRQRVQTSTITAPATTANNKGSFAIKDGYANKKMSAAGAPIVPSTGVVAIQKPVPGAVTPAPAPVNTAAKQVPAQQQVKVDYKAPVTQYTHSKQGKQLLPLLQRSSTTSRLPLVPRIPRVLPVASVAEVPEPFSQTTLGWFCFC